VTELRCPTGVVEITDALTLRAGANLTEDAAACRGELLRSVRVTEGELELEVHLALHGDARWSSHGGSARIEPASQPALKLYLEGSLGISEPAESVTLRAGEERFALLRWGGGSLRGRAIEPEALLAQTAEAWKRWIERLRYAGPHAEMVRRSAITLKLLDYFQTGAWVAAATSSLPAPIGGVRNWDYRYSWIRDASYTAAYCPSTIRGWSQRWRRSVVSSTPGAGCCTATCQPPRLMASRERKGPSCS
jgi:hypothetical protein